MGSNLLGRQIPVAAAFNGSLPFQKRHTNPGCHAVFLAWLAPCMNQEGGLLT